ncbi:hypothetical protein ACJ73_06971 [Blastomyces percursus]|uniref:Uncharacterized protein n=1 Tax=Blastomyces percursus TaxID=1658174 RepID=A0A1J9PZD6_9EURO|nr:hypothetical protein ACJ73_06971 [Blastomyces percursus]
MAERHASVSTAAGGDKQYPQTTAEKHAVAMAEVWRNEDERYAELVSFITSYDRAKAEGVLSILSDKKYNDIRTTIHASASFVDEFPQWLSAFRSEETKHTRDRGAIAPAFHDVSFSRDADNVLRLQTELEERKALLGIRERAVTAKEKEVDETSRKWKVNIARHDDARERLRRQQEAVNDAIAKCNAQVATLRKEGDKNRADRQDVAAERAAVEEMLEELRQREEALAAADRERMQIHLDPEDDFQFQPFVSLDDLLGGQQDPIQQSGIRPARVRPALKLVQPHLDARRLDVAACGRPAWSVPLPPYGGPRDNDRGVGADNGRNFSRQDHSRLGQNTLRMEDCRPTRADSRPHRLCATDVLLFDPEDVDVMVFIDRLRYMSTQEGEDAILRVFPLCLKKRALEWHVGLSDDTKVQMSTSLDTTLSELKAEFKLSEGEAWTQAQELQFTFEESATMPLSLYISRKINLLHAVSIRNETMVKRLIWEGLDRSLSLITPLVATEKLDDFRRRIRDNETAARRAWSERQEQFKAYSPKPAAISTLTGAVPAKEANAPPRRTAPAKGGCYDCGGRHYAAHCPLKGAQRAHLVEHSDGEAEAADRELQEDYSSGGRDSEN